MRVFATDEVGKIVKKDVDERRDLTYILGHNCFLGLEEALVDADRRLKREEMEVIRQIEDLKNKLERMQGRTIIIE